MEGSSSRPGFQSRRSYPSFNHLSLTPLTPRYPIDDDDLESESQGYYSARSASPDTERPPSTNDYTSTPRPASYLSSMSVPGTPGVLSQTQSRSTSRARTRHSRSKSSSRMNHDGTRTPRRSSSSRPRRSADGDSEWMLRTGIMLASSTREEKGQSWLVKRASSTSLASEVANNNSYFEDHAAAAAATASSSRPRSSTNSKAASQKSRSEVSTPSRPGSRSSRRGSRPDLATSGLEMTPSYTWVSTPAGGKSEFTPDAVDERIRAEMVNMQQNADVDVNMDDGASSSSLSASDASSDSEDEIDEKEMRRLTRESGFGLGSWLDRMVEWTFFGVDEWPTLFSAGSDNRDNRDPPTPDGDRVVENRQVTSEAADDKHMENYSDIATIFSTDGENFTLMVDKPGDVGGWEDARWFLKTIKQALVL